MHDPFSFGCKEQYMNAILAYFDLNNREATTPFSSYPQASTNKRLWTRTPFLKPFNQYLLVREGDGEQNRQVTQLVPWRHGNRRCSMLGRLLGYYSVLALYNSGGENYHFQYHCVYGDTLCHCWPDPHAFYRQKRHEI